MYFEMTNRIVFIAFWVVFTATVFIACNEEDTEQIIIQADIPAFVKLQNTYNNLDTLKFRIISDEAMLESIQLVEGEDSYVYLQRGIDFDDNIREYNLRFLYNPKSAGVKNYTLIIIAEPYKKDFSFSIRIEE
jgi:hypothetical protein